MTSSRTPTFVARSPEDVLAVVPVVLGFAPTDSVVMLTFGGARTFHARVDLPTDAADVPDVVDALVEPAVRHRIERVVVVLYSGEERRAGRTAHALARALEQSGIDVVDCLRADGRCWFPLLGRHRGAPPGGVPYDVSGHPFAAEAVVEGFVTHASRDDLARSVAADPARVGRLAAALDATAPPPSTSWLEEGTWARRVVEAHAGGASVATDAELVRLLRGLRHLRVRDAAWSLLRREVAKDHVAFWTDVVRRAPTELVPAPAALLAFAAWLAGHGALAWCALDRVTEVAPDYVMAARVAEVLEQALPPDAWVGGFDWTAPAAALPGASPDVA